MHERNKIRGPGAKPLVGWALPNPSEVFARLFQKAVGSRGKAPGGFGQSPTSFPPYKYSCLL